MLEYLIVGIIVSSAVAFFCFKAVKLIRRRGKGLDCGCEGGDCGDCAAMNKGATTDLRGKDTDLR